MAQHRVDVRSTDEVGVAFFEGVVNAVFSGVAPEDAEGIAAERAAGRALVGYGKHRDDDDDDGGVFKTRVKNAGAPGTRYGFKRDQPAVWHVLATAGRASAGRRIARRRATRGTARVTRTKTPSSAGTGVTGTRCNGRRDGRG